MADITLYSAQGCGFCQSAACRKSISVTRMLGGFNDLNALDKAGRLDALLQS